jgi:Fic family protein
VSFRAGKYVQQPRGFKAFLPADLPPVPPLTFDAELTKLLSDADRALGRLDGVASVLPNPDLFVSMYVKHEAVLSSQIEGTQSTLEDILEFEADAKQHSFPDDLGEVVNYVAAMRHGIHRLPELPLSLRLIREIHEKLMQGVRGSERQPGEFRTSQNWIGPAGCNLNTAEFVPPPPHEMNNALSSFEKFLHEHRELPVLVHCALAHAQFETIHPFLDGNGRVGRLLITLLLCEREILRQPLLYLSFYLKQRRTAYYEHLMGIRLRGEWEAWVKFFLKGVFEVSQSATATARAILELRGQHQRMILVSSTSSHTPKLLDLLYQTPILSVATARDALGCSHSTATSIIAEFVDLGLLDEITGQQRNRRWRYTPYLNLFEKQIE